jgi:hypothetical protein
LLGGSSFVAVKSADLRYRGTTCPISTAPVDSVQEFRGVTAGFLSGAAGGGGGQYELVLAEIS